MNLGNRIGLALAGLALLVATPLSAEDAAYDLDIESQPLAAALKEFAEQSGLQVVYYSKLADGEESSEVSGAMTANQAMTRLLASTDLTFDTMGDDTVVIEEAPAPAKSEVTSESGNAQLTPSAVLTAQASRESSEVREEAAVSRRETESLPAAERAERLEEIIVTGTHIRGIAPESSPTIVFDREDISRSGVLSTDEFIRTIPQNFGGGTTSLEIRGFPDSVESASNTSSATSVNLRGLGGNATLTLLNGRRLSPSGDIIGVVDVSAVPLSAIERIEVLTDGASSIYGGDAIAGVVNMVLRDDYDGAETSVSYGNVTEGDFEQVRVAQALGKSWPAGNLLISYEYFNQDLLSANEKEFAEPAIDPFTLIPRQERHGVTGVLSQDITDNLTFNLTGFYSDRSSDVLVNARSIEIIDDRADQTQLLIAPSLEYTFVGDWRLVLVADYSKTSSTRDLRALDVETREETSFRRFDTDASQSSFDVIADGPLFEVPGGVVRLAFGGAYRSEDFRFTNEVFGDVLGSADRDVWAAFGELYIPIVGDANKRPGLERFEINISARLDDHSDFGRTTNPKVGLLWSPVPKLNLRGSYTTSFNPPSLATLGDPTTGLTTFPATNPDPMLPDVPAAFLTGIAVLDLEAEESRTYTAGFDYSFDLLGGEISISSTYYDVEFEERIDNVPFLAGFNFFNILDFRDDFGGELFIDNPSLERVQAFIDLANATGGQFLDVIEIFTGTPADLANLGFIFDFRTQNLAATKTNGVDFSVSYNIGTDIGDFTLSVAGDHILEFTKKLTSGSPEVEALNRLFNPVDLRLRGSFGWSNNHWTISSFVSFTSSYEDDRVLPVVPIGSWTTVDFTIGYNFDDGLGTSLLSNLRSSLSVRNVFDQDPPFVADDGLEFSAAFYDPANANPLGRFISLQLTKQW